MDGSKKNSSNKKVKKYQKMIKLVIFLYNIKKLSTFLGLFYAPNMVLCYTGQRNVLQRTNIV